MEKVKYEYIYIDAPNFDDGTSEHVEDDTPTMYWKYGYDTRGYVYEDNYTGFIATYNFLPDSELSVYASPDDIKRGYINVDLNWNDYTAKNLTLKSKDDGKQVTKDRYEFFYKNHTYYLSKYFNGPLIMTAPGAWSGFTFGYVNGVPTAYPDYSDWNLIARQWLYYNYLFGVSAIGYYTFRPTEKLKKYTTNIEPFTIVNNPVKFTTTTLPEKFTPTALPPKVDLKSSVEHNYVNPEDDPNDDFEDPGIETITSGLSANFDISADVVKDTDYDASHMI